MTRPSTRSRPSRAVRLRMLLEVRRRLARRRAYDGSSERERRTWRDRRLSECLDHAAGHSAFYRDRLARFEALDSLPVLDKSDLLTRFDTIVTDPRLRRSDLAAFTAAGAPGSTGTGHRVAVTSGSSGVPAILAFDRDEWVDLIVNAARARALAGPLPDRHDGRRRAGSVRSAKIGSPSPWHLSTQLPRTFEDPRSPSLRLSATDPIDETVAALAVFGPTILSAYPSVLRRVAAASMSGLDVPRPARVFASGEHLGDQTRDAVLAAWGVEIFDQYVATEVGFIAAQCRVHDGYHVLDDHVIVEVIDGHGLRCPPGTEGDVVLTALHARTVPLIRYRIGDRATLRAGPCPCGRPGPVLAGIAGADRDVLTFRSGADGRPGVQVHPVALTAVTDRLAVGSWVVHHDTDRLRLSVTTPAATFDADSTRDRLLEALAGAGVPGTVEVTVEVVDAIPATGGGKAARFRAFPDGEAPMGAPGTRRPNGPYPG